LYFNFKNYFKQHNFEKQKILLLQMLKFLQFFLNSPTKLYTIPHNIIIQVRFEFLKELNFDFEVE